jgi:hypothetical protein
VVAVHFASFNSILEYVSSESLSIRRGQLAVDGLAQRLYVALGRLSEEPAILTSELGCAFIPNLQFGTAHIEELGDHESPSLMKPKLLLILRGLIAVIVRKW